MAGLGAERCSRALGRRVRPLLLALRRRARSRRVAHSWAVRFGEAGVFPLRGYHLGVVVLLALAGVGLDVGALYWLGVAAVAVLLAYEHSLVRPGDLRRLDAAFFTINGVISIVFFAFVLLDVATR